MDPEDMIDHNHTFPFLWVRDREFEERRRDQCRQDLEHWEDIEFANRDRPTGQYYGPYISYGRGRDPS